MLRNIQHISDNWSLKGPALAGETNYIWILLRYISFHIQVEVGLCVMSPILERFKKTFYEITILRRIYSNRVWIELPEFSLKLHNKIFVQIFRCAAALWKYWVCKYSIRFQVIILKLLCETLKNEKWKILAWYPNKMWRIANKILNAAIDVEQTFKFASGLKLANETNEIKKINPRIFMTIYSHIILELRRYTWTIICPMTLWTTRVGNFSFTVHTIRSFFR